jgi:hypothetical protein
MLRSDRWKRESAKGIQSHRLSSEVKISREEDESFCDVDGSGLCQYFETGRRKKLQRDGFSRVAVLR